MNTRHALTHFVAVFMILLVLCLLPAGRTEARAEPPSQSDPVSGSCGQNGSNLSWACQNHTLTISGSGSMSDFIDLTVPWRHLCSQIQTVVVEEGVTDVGEYAFYNCSALVTAYLPSTLQRIRDYAFAGSASLADVYINTDQRTFNTSVNWDRPKNISLDGADMHFTAKAIGQAGENLFWILSNSDFLSFTGSGSMYNWSSASEVPWYSYRTAISGVNLANCSSVGDYAFCGCTRMTIVSIPSSVSYLGQRAFSGCTLLGAAYFANPALNIPVACFSGCFSLQIISIPANATSIGASAFSGCHALTSVYFSANSALTSVGNSAFYNCYNLGNISLPDTVTSLGDNAFYGCKSMTSLPLSSGLNSLGESCFSGCSGVTEMISIPAGINRIPNRCFLGCSGFYKLTLTPGVTEIGPYAFSGCSKLTHVEYDGFRTQWEYVTVSGGNSLLTNAAFSWLFRTGALSPDVRWTIYGSSGELYIWGDGSIPDWSGADPAPWAPYSGYIREVGIQNGVKSIGNHSFYGFNAMTAVTIANSVRSVGSNAFLYCSSLTDIWYGGSAIEHGNMNISDTGNSRLKNATWHYTEIGGIVDDEDGFATDLHWKLDEAGVLTVYWDPDSMDMGEMEIPDYTDYRGTPWYQYGAGNGQILPMITTVRVGEEVTRIGDYAFSGLAEVTEVEIASTVTGIGDGAFDGCSNLAAIVLPDTVESLGSSVFWNCGSLEHATLPSGLTEIPYGSFYACDNLHTVHIPASVTSIRKYAFSDCNDMASGRVYFGGNSAQWSAIDLYSGNDALNTATVYFTPPEIRVDAVNFPDAAFRSYVAENIDQDRSGWLNDGERLSVGGIYCPGKKIEDLTGILFFPNITHLDCSNNLISGTLVLSDIPHLQSVNCGGNELTTLVVTGLTDLKTLICADNDDGLSAPDLSTNVALEYLDCSGCDGMEDLDLSANTALTDLNCRYNQLESLDLSANTALQQLNCSSNNLSSLDLSASTDLYQVTCSNNGLTALNLGQQPRLITLVCYGNSLPTLDLTDSPKLTDAVHNGIRSETDQYVEYRRGADYVQADGNTMLITGVMDTPDFDLPAGLQLISDEGFAGVRAAVVWIPDGVTEIGIGAFRNCTTLRQIRIPMTVTEIAADAFDGVPTSQLTIFGTPGSAAQGFAAMTGIRFFAE